MRNFSWTNVSNFKIILAHNSCNNVSAFAIHSMPKTKYNQFLKQLLAIENFLYSSYYSNTIKIAVHFLSLQVFCFIISNYSCEFFKPKAVIIQILINIPNNTVMSSPMYNSLAILESFFEIHLDICCNQWIFQVLCLILHIIVEYVKEHCTKVFFNCLHITK